jgi:hypothetical protein
MAIEWEDHHKAEYYVGKIGSAKFEINSGGRAKSLRALRGCAICTADKGRPRMDTNRNP